MKKLKEMLHEAEENTHSEPGVFVNDSELSDSEERVLRKLVMENGLSSVLSSLGTIMGQCADKFESKTTIFPDMVKMLRKMEEIVDMAYGQVRSLRLHK